MSRETLTFFFFMYVNECSLILLPDLVVVMLTHKQRPLTNLTPQRGESARKQRQGGTCKK